MELWEALVSIFWFFLLVAWFWLLITIVTDIFRDRTLSGWGKGLWCLFVVLLPWLGVLVYLIARGPSMHERAIEHAQQNERDFRQYVRDAAQPTGVADELGKLADLRDRGAITDTDYEAAKARLLSTTANSSMSHTRDAADTPG
jgi:hypothetical protein